MPFRARTVHDVRTSGLKPAGTIECDGVTFTGADTVFSGTPTAAMLAHDHLWIETVNPPTPWSQSVGDRLGEKAGAIRLLELEGKWPTEYQRAWDAAAEKKLADPEGVNRAILHGEGLRGMALEQAVAQAVSPSSKAQPPDIDALANESGDKPADPPKRRRGRPPKVKREESAHVG